MKRLLPPLFALLLLTACGGAKTEKMIESGNQAFADEAYETALEAYVQAAAAEPELAEPLYNAANVHYRQGAFDQAGETMAVALSRADETLSAAAQFNLGNSRFQTEQYAEAAAAFKDALRLNPDDLEAKVNLELTLQKLQQQEQQEQEQENENQEQQEQGSEGDQSQESEQQDQDGESSEEQQEQSEPSEGDEQSPEQDSGEQNQDSQSEEQNQEQGDQGQDEQQNQDGQSGEKQEEESQSGQSDEERQEDGNGESADPAEAQQPEEGEQQDEQADAGQEAEPQAEPEAGQGGAGQPGEETDQPPTAAGAMAGDVEGLTEEQARQLLIAAGQGTQTLQETLQQMYAFPYADVEQDW